MFESCRAHFASRPFRALAFTGGTRFPPWAPSSKHHKMNGAGGAGASWKTSTE